MNMNNNYVQEIIKNLNAFLESKGFPKVSVRDVIFVMDEDVMYTTEEIITVQKIVSAEKIEKLIAPLIKAGPSWIHINLFSSKESFKFVTLKFGASVGNPSPNINVSYEKDKTINVANV